MNPRHAFFACLQRSPPALFEAALWIAVEHDAEVQPQVVLEQFMDLVQRSAVACRCCRSASWGNRCCACSTTWATSRTKPHPVASPAALLNKVLERRRAAAGVGADHPGTGTSSGDPHGRGQLPRPLPAAGARRRSPARPLRRSTLVPQRLPELLQRQYGPNMALNAEHLLTSEPLQMLQRLSRNLRRFRTWPTTTTSAR